jgi:hypothetical protein
MATLNPQPLPPVVRRIAVNVTSDVANDQDKLAKVYTSVLKFKGCPQCNSGLDIFFNVREEFAVNPQSLEVSAVTPSNETVG